MCLAVQLIRSGRPPSVAVVERRAGEAPEAAHKVGESSVEIASRYLTDVLGLPDLVDRELPKFGLRFFMSHGDNRDVTRRMECGPSHFLHVPSYQIDRGRFENGLAARARSLGVTVLDGAVVRDVELGSGETDHAITIETSEGGAELRSRWLIDATGRSALLKKRLGLAKGNRHTANAAWFRVDAPIDPDQWSADPAWRTRLAEPRRLSTNHLMGLGYWVWLIPLAGDRTSVGIVADDALHPFSEISSFEKALGWLERHEPQCAAAVESVAEARMDFRAMRDYSHDAKRVFSADRWCLVGESGVFVDPLYSPGSDFIAIANGFVTDLVERDLRGEDVSALADLHDRSFRNLARSYLITYQGQYALMGHARVMTTKVVWDFLMYWAGIAPLFFAGRLLDSRVMHRARPLLQRFASLNRSVQSLFRRWADASAMDPPGTGAYVDYAEIDALDRLNAALLESLDDEDLPERLEANLALAYGVRDEIVREAAHWLPELAGAEPTAEPSRQLDPMFAAMRG